MPKFRDTEARVREVHDLYETRRDNLWTAAVEGDVQKFIDEEDILVKTFNAMRIAMSEHCLERNRVKELRNEYQQN